MTEEEQREEILSRIEDAATRLAELKKTFPDSKIGIICALPTKGLLYEWAYLELMKHSKAVNAPLDFIHIDCPAPALISGNIITWDELSNIKRVIRETLGIEYGFVITDGNAGRVSNRAFYDAVMFMAKEFPIKDYPDYFIMMSWFPFPIHSVRMDGTPDGAFSMTRTSLDFIKWVSTKRESRTGVVIEYRNWEIDLEGRKVTVKAVLEKVDTGKVFLRDFDSGRVAGFRGKSLSAEDKDYVKRVLGLQ